MYNIDENYILPHGEPMGFPVAVSAIDGSYIGRIEEAVRLANLGIAAQARPGKEVASIGFCEKEQKWYGWSHRAIHGFGIGSTVEKGDCAYSPTGWDDFVEDCIRFWSDEWRLNVAAYRSEDTDGNLVCEVQWTNTEDPELVPNPKARGQEGHSIMYPPEAWGNGEWTAETLEDAKQMAMDFAEGVA